MKIISRQAALGIALAGAIGVGGLGAAPALAHDDYGARSWGYHEARYGRDDHRDYRYRHRHYDERVTSRTRVWQGRDGRYYCRKKDGTTGLLIGGAVGGVIGHGIAGRGDKTVGTILGVAGGALLGRAIDRDNSRCR